MKKFLVSKKFWVPTVIVIGGIIVWFSLNSAPEIPEGIEIATVGRGEVEEIVSETGYVLPTQSLDMAYERGGRVVEIFAQEGASVQQGDILVRLEQSGQAADLSSALARLEAEHIRLQELQNGADTNSLAVIQSNVESAEIVLENAKKNLSEITSQQNQLVENAGKTLRSSNLQAYLVSDTGGNASYSYDAPVVTGTYASTEEGLYTVSVYGSGGTSGSSFRLSGLENDTESVSSDRPTPIGTRGLYIQFPDNFAKNTDWEIPIPNIRSSSYLANLNAYNATVDARRIALLNAENAVSSAEAGLRQYESQYTQLFEPARVERINAQRAVVRQMEATVETAQIAYEATVLRAPFPGVVTTVDVDLGEVVSPSTPIVSVISTDMFDLLVYVSESDIRELSVGDTATIMLDAYDDLEFLGTVTRIAHGATLVDGVRVFEVRLQFTEKNDLIRSGLSADIDILTTTRSNVIAVPSRAVVEREDGKFVRTLVGEKIEYLPVKTGLRGSNGMTEIVSGISEGQSIIAFADGEALKLLEEN